MFGVHAPDEVGMCDYIPDDDDESDDESIDYDSDYSGYDCCSDGMSDLERDDDEFLDCIEYPDVGRPLEGDLDLSPFSEINSEESEDGDDEAEEVDSDMIRAIEEQLKNKKAIRKAIDGEQIDPWQESKQMDPWQQPKRPVRGADKIRGNPLTMAEAHRNPFEMLTESSEAVTLETEGPNAYERHVKRIEGCMSNSASISSIPHIPSNTPNTAVKAVAQACEEYRLDNSIETPPGLEAKKLVNICTSGLNDKQITVVGHVVENPIELDTPQTTIDHKTNTPYSPFNFDDLSVQEEKIKIGNEEVKPIAKYESIDILCISDSDQPIDPEDMVYNLGKITDDDSPFPVSIPTSLIKRSKSRPKKT